MVAATESTLRQFKRVYELTVVRQPDPTSFAGQNPGFFEQLGNAAVISELQMLCEIKKDAGKEANKCKITVFNLNKSSRDAIEKLPVYVTLRAGHDGVLRLLFSGSLMPGSYSELKKEDWQTVMFVHDGGAALADARLTKSYKPPVEVRQVVSDLAASMGLKLPPEVDQSADLRQAIATGISLHGPTRDLLTKVIAPYGYSYSVQNGRLQFLKDGTTIGNADILIDSGNLIGSPERIAPNKKTGVSELKCDVMLYPEIIPGVSVRVTSRGVNGRFKVTDVEHKLDYRGKDWKTEIKGKPI